MAFVTPVSLTSSFTASHTHASICRATPTHLGDRASSTASRPSRAPRMAFSSIDEPETSVSIRDLSIQSKDEVIIAAYKHVFGNAYVMEEERKDLEVAESQFRLGESDVRALVLAMGLSPAYRTRFFDRCGPYRFVELNFKHFLGRAPESQPEVSEHVQRLVNEGYEAEIKSYVLSDEYMSAFGLDEVPRFVYKGTYARADDFNRMNIIRQYWDGCSTSTVSGSTAVRAPAKARLLMTHGDYVTNPSAVAKGILAGHDPKPLEPMPNAAESPLNANAAVRIRVQIAMNLYRVYETSPYLSSDVKDETEPSPWEKVLRDSGKSFNGKYF